MSKRFACADIGSNTIKVTIADYSGNNHFNKVLYKDFSSGLGQSLSNQNIINESKLAACYRALNEIKSIIEENKVNEYRYIATHALREAVNQTEILSLIKSNTGIDVTVISGEEEARLTLTGILMDFPSSKSYACINAGGGSTELSFHLPGKVRTEQVYFFRFGAVNLFSDYLRDKADIETAIKKISDLVGREFKGRKIADSLAIDDVISVGGSIYNAAYILKKDKQRNFNDLQGMKLSISDLESVIDQLKTVNKEQKKNITGLDTKRIETVLPGMLIHYNLLKLLKKKELVISTRTISDGLIYQMAKMK